MAQWGELSTLSDTELLRYVDRSNPQVAELARRYEALARGISEQVIPEIDDLVQQLREVAGL